MVSFFLLFLFGIMAYLTWENYLENPTTSRIAIALIFTSLTIVSGIKALSFIFSIFLMFILAFCVIGIITSLGDLFINQITYWDIDDEDFLPDDENELDNSEQ